MALERLHQPNRVKREARCDLPIDARRLHTSSSRVAVDLVAIAADHVHHADGPPLGSKLLREYHGFGVG
jgi:hypothetical protein